MTGRDLISDAAQELGVLGQGESLSAGNAAFLLGKLNRLIDNWNAQRAAIYADQFLTFTLTPSLQPHTIGPTGATWTADRPVSIEGVTLMLTAAALTLTPRDAPWWQALASPTLSSATPTDFYYRPSAPNGSLYLYPIPSAAYDVQLLVRTVLAAVTLDTVLVMPPGYRDALTLTVAEEAAAGFGTQAPPTLVLSATKARARIFANNVHVPRLITQDSGMPGGPPAYFDWTVGS